MSEKIIKLTKEQNDIAYYKKSGILVVKGVAGSGKTVVGLHRIPYLKEYLCNESQDTVNHSDRKTYIFLVMHYGPLSHSKSQSQKTVFVVHALGEDHKTPAPTKMKQLRCCCCCC